MDYYVNRMLTKLPSELTFVEIASDIAAGFVGSTGYIDRIEPCDFHSRKADVLHGKDQYGRQFISMLVLDTRLSARTLLEIAGGGTLSEGTQDAVAWAAKPRVLTLFQRYQNRADLFVTAGDRMLSGPPKDLPAGFYEIMIDAGGQYCRVTQADLGNTTEVAVPEHKPFVVDGYHIDGTVGVINM